MNQLDKSSEKREAADTVQDHAGTPCLVQKDFFALSFALLHYFNATTSARMLLARRVKPVQRNFAHFCLADVDMGTQKHGSLIGAPI